MDVPTIKSHMTSILEDGVVRLDPNRSPLVSVIVPAYDVAEFIAEALDSVLAQTFDDYEIIVINDG